MTRRRWIMANFSKFVKGHEGWAYVVSQTKRTFRHHHLAGITHVNASETVLLQESAFSVGGAMAQGRYIR